jgi:hypothetical protein
MNEFILGDIVIDVETGEQMVFDSYGMHMGAPAVFCKDIETGELIKRAFDPKKIKRADGV